MKSKSIHKWLGVAALLATATGAGACEITRDDIIGVWRGKCNLTIDPKGPRFEQVFIDGTLTPTPLKMPDLEIRRFDFAANGNEVLVFVYVRNIGTQTSAATNVGVNVDAVGASDNATQHNPLPLHPVPSLPAMTEQLIYMGAIYVNNSGQDVDLMTTGMVDQVTAAQPVRGTVIESNESNNGKAALCRVFGPMPAMVVPGC